MYNSTGADVARKELGVNADVSSGIDDNCAREQNFFEQPPFRTICVSFESAINLPIERKGVFVDLISGAIE
jgi:hypothetical protein